MICEEYVNFNPREVETRFFFFPVVFATFSSGFIDLVVDSNVDEIVVLAALSSFCFFIMDFSSLGLVGTYILCNTCVLFFNNASHGLPSKHVLSIDL